MKIYIKKLPPITLGQGYHEVIVSNITEGVQKGIKYFSCRFENDSGFFNKKFYLTDYGEKSIFQLLKAIEINLNQEEIDTNDLTGKKLIIRIEEKQFFNSERKLFQIGNDITEFINLRDNTKDDYYFDDLDDREYFNQSDDDLDFYCGDPDDFRYGGLIGDEAIACWLSTN